MTDDILILLEGLYRAIEAGKVAVMPSQMGYGNYSLQNEDKTLCLNFERTSNFRLKRTPDSRISRIGDYESYVSYRLYQHSAINHTIEMIEPGFKMATKVWELIESKNTLKSTKDILAIVNSINEDIKKPIVREKVSRLISATHAKHLEEESYGTYEELLTFINDRIEFVARNGGKYTQVFQKNDVYGIIRKIAKYLPKLTKDLNDLGYEIRSSQQTYLGQVYTISWE